MSDREALEQIAALNREVGDHDQGHLIAWLKAMDVLRKVSPPIEPEVH